MKLKSILIMAMVAILAIAGGAMAATTTTNSNNTFDTPGFAGGVILNWGGGSTACNSVAGTIVTCTSPTAAQLAALGGFVADSQTGSGTGLQNGMPAQVAYALNQYTGGVGPLAGYQLTQSLFGMCAFSGGVQGACPKFVPPAAGITLLRAEGGDTTGTIPGSTALIPGGSVGAFNEATFLTGLVSGFTGAGFTNQLSQKTTHHAAVTGGTLTNTDGDYIDQRLSQVIGTVQTLNQQVQAGGSSGTSVIVTVDAAAAQDPLWLLNVDAYGPNVQNSGLVNQAVADSNSAGVGDYGQLFSNTDVTIANNITPAGVPGAATTYNAIAPVFTGAPGGSLP